MPKRRRRRRTRTVLLLLVLAACGREPTPAAAPAGEPPTASSPVPAGEPPTAGSAAAGGAEAGSASEAGSAEAQTPAPPGNQLVNPGFEQGRAGWSYRDQSPQWGDFSIVASPVHSGHAAAYLALRQAADAPLRQVRVHGVVQEISPATIPQRLGGFYRVDRWEKSTPGPDLYLQAVVIVWGDPRTPQIVNPIQPMAMLQNYQLRYYLAGLGTPAFRISNAKIEIVSGDPPKLSQWVPFEVPLRADFQRLWGVEPKDYQMLRIFFEARWDNMPAGGSLAADVYYDDLYVE